VASLWLIMAVLHHEPASNVFVQISVVVKVLRDIASAG
jgi:hypothetical protein